MPKKPRYFVKVRKTKKHKEKAKFGGSYAINFQPEQSVYKLLSVQSSGCSQHLHLPEIKDTRVVTVAENL